MMQQQKLKQTNAAQPSGFSLQFQAQTILQAYHGQGT
jgi:hypothetical protein